jgi:murein L,D-transpeptidase YcbB/YkuD
MRGADVMQLMRRLVVHGTLPTFDVNIDSLFTAEVEVAVREFQRRHGIDPDGKVGPVTTLYLMRAP